MSEGIEDGSALGDCVGNTDSDGLIVGSPLGRQLGSGLGSALGDSDGVEDGILEGISVDGISVLDV